MVVGEQWGYVMDICKAGTDERGLVLLWISFRGFLWRVWCWSLDQKTIKKKIFYNSCGPYVIFYIQLKIIPPDCERNDKHRKKWIV